MAKQRWATGLALALIIGGCSQPAPLVRTADPDARGYTDKDFPRIRELAANMYSYEQLRSAGDERFTTVSMFVVTGEGVLVADGQGSVEETQRMIDHIAEITDQPITLALAESCLRGMPMRRAQVTAEQVMALITGEFAITAREQDLQVITASVRARVPAESWPYVEAGIERLRELERELADVRVQLAAQEAAQPAPVSPPGLAARMANRLKRMLS
jgi:hypothetical protein